MIREARPEALSRTEFIHRMEVLIQSGVGPPINAILIAPQRPVRYKHSDDIEVETHVTNKLKVCPFSASSLNSDDDDGGDDEYTNIISFSAYISIHILINLFLLLLLLSLYP